MRSRWFIPAAAIALISGSMVMSTGATAGAATVTHHHGTTRTRPGGGSARGFVPGGLIKLPHGARTSHKGTKFQSESDNWSGYAATGSAGAFNSVSASWSQPGATCDDGGTEYSSFWVGLDGYNSSSVEQTGTDSDCNGGSPAYYGWYEMFPADPVYYTDPVQPGDAMTASVTFNGTDTYTLTLTDNSEGWTENINQQEAGLSDSSAEVITEAPSSETGPLPLADFNEVDYSGASANGESLSDFNPDQIIMVGQSGDQLDSTSQIDGSGDFSNFWQAQS